MSPFGMLLLLAIGLIAFGITARKRWQLMLVGTMPLDRGDRSGERVQSVWKYMFGQLRMFRYKGAGIAHALIFAGFSILSLRTIVLIARGFSSDPQFGFWLFDDDAPLGMAYLFLKDVIGIGVIAGVLYFMHQRLVVKPQRMNLSTEGIIILCMIMSLILSDMTYEATGYIREAEAHGGGLFHLKTPFASLYAMLLKPILQVEAINNLYYLGFWGHTILVLLFLNFLPHGKHFHILTVLPNVYARNLDGIGRLRNIEDIEGRLEREETLGVKGPEDLAWKDTLDFYTCTECGRCTDHCPANNTGKLLSPKQLTVDMRNAMYENEEQLIQVKPADENAGNDDSGAFNFVPQFVNPDTIWACTTCGACEQECPVFISYVDKIVDLRRNLVMEQGEFPAQLQNAFRGLETVGNPYSAGPETRADWAEGLNVPLVSDKPDAEYLYWVGCAPSYDDRSRKIARAFVQLMQKAGVDFAILGPEEMCNGDPARRSGNEYLFEILAKQNVETMQGYDIRKIVTTCPHCFNTLANEYGAFGGNYDVIHHTDLLAKLLDDNKLKAVNRCDETVTYHDSCYIGRYNDIYDPPRRVLEAIPGLKLVEPEETRDRGMCCGAGGAQMWKEEEEIVRDDAKHGSGKVNHARTHQLLKVLPSNNGGGGGGGCGIASACPFCKTMLSDGLTDNGKEQQVKQKDVAEYLWEAVQ